MKQAGEKMYLSIDLMATSTTVQSHTKNTNAVFTSVTWSWCPILDRAEPEYWRKKQLLVFIIREHKHTEQCSYSLQDLSVAIPVQGPYPAHNRVILDIHICPAWQQCCRRWGRLDLPPGCRISWEAFLHSGVQSLEIIHNMQSTRP